MEVTVERNNPILGQLSPLLVDNFYFSQSFDFSCFFNICLQIILLLLPLFLGFAHAF